MLTVIPSPPNVYSVFLSFFLNTSIKCHLQLYMLTRPEIKAFEFALVLASEHLTEQFSL